ncbi:Tyrosine-protein kinase [Parasponia andersonii]|uniref:Tyrosine-protein kinase n=1 Tax=Parasponia andersonii TaxID=3476 RepID=A0A2P5A867_PARAD|nr:Tyrosine-protein kinase [Parasponia andersonii]
MMTLKEEQGQEGEGGFRAVYSGYLPDSDALDAVKKISKGSRQGENEYITERSPLTWAVTYKISVGIASALLYLHEEWERCVVHQDTKSSNVMLDSSFNVKLGDFGLVRLMDRELGPQTTGLVGTLGCLALEYVSTGRASKELDVYSFDGLRNCNRKESSSG